jgi:glycine cleavage system H protein
MSNIPQNLRYTKDHEWARLDGDVVTVGITEHAVGQLGDITLVTLPSPGTQVTAGATFGDIDSVKAVSELYAPLSGEIVERNGALEDQPEIVNADPYDKGWMVKIRVASAAEFGTLLDAAGYAKLLAEG